MTQPAKTHPLHVGTAIRTTYHGATKTRESCIKATCERGSTRRGYDHGLSFDQNHAAAADALKAKFTAEDAARTPPHPTATNPWNRPTQQGALPDGSHAHTYPNT